MFSLPQSLILLDRSNLGLTNRSSTSFNILSSPLSIVNELSILSVLCLSYPQCVCYSTCSISVHQPFKCSFLFPLNILTCGLFPSLSKLNIGCVTWTTVFLLHLSLRLPKVDHPDSLLSLILVYHSTTYSCPCIFRVSKPRLVLRVLCVL